ncbi:MAG: C1 family peptidase [Phormidesmis sp.]
MSDTFIHRELNKGTGWIADPIDERDKQLSMDVPAKLPTSIDLREWCSPIKDQGKINSCTAHAAIALMEYYQRRSFGKTFDASRLFLYKVTRNLINNQQDNGANARSTMKALALFGVPPEEYWPYDATKIYEEPTAFCYALASNYQALKYYRLDVKGTTREVVLQQIKANLANNRPLMFGSILDLECLEQSKSTGKMPVPSKSPDAKGINIQWIGHTMAAVGYDDSITIKNAEPASTETVGAILVRNSWGSEWGEGGYGWLPYNYVLQPLTNDWWTMLTQEWLDTGKFETKSSGND